MKFGNATVSIGAVFDESARNDARRLYRSKFDLAIDLADTSDATGDTCDALLIDVDLSDARKVLALKAGVLAAAAPGAYRIVMIDRGDRTLVAQANGLGATDILYRPFDLADLHDCFSRAGLHQRAGMSSRARGDRADQPGVSSITGAATALGTLFSALSHDGLMDMARLNEASAEIIDAVAESGVDRWLDTVRSHHVGTFQHCLLVTGVATSFAQSVGMRRDDTQRLTTAALLHDIGKARIPLEILNKTQGLDADEFEVMKLHPVFGYDYLLTQSDIPPEVLAGVRHHHEYLDGSGYPDGLAGQGIDDLTRVLTVCDIYGALVEKRAYKKPRTSAEALDILVGMARDGKVERALVLALHHAMRATSAA